MFQEEFSKRLTALRLKRGISARDMSLSIGQNAGYINNIETGKALPSMSSFFYICDYLQVSPKEFFDLDSQQPEKLRLIVERLKQLDTDYLDSISVIIEGLAEKK